MVWMRCYIDSKRALLHAGGGTWLEACLEQGSPPFDGARMDDRSFVKGRHGIRSARWTFAQTLAELKGCRKLS